MLLVQRVIDIVYAADIDESEVRSPDRECKEPSHR